MSKGVSGGKASGESRREAVAERDGEIVRLSQEGWTQRRLAGKFDMSQGGVRKVLRRMSAEQRVSTEQALSTEQRVSTEQVLSTEQPEASAEQAGGVSTEQRMSTEQTGKVTTPKVTTPKVAAVDDGLAGRVDVDKLRGWALRVRRESKAMASKVEGLTARLDALQKDKEAWNPPFAEGLPFRVRRRERREPLTVDELAAKMVRNGVDEATARRNAERIKANLRKAGA